MVLKPVTDVAALSSSEFDAVVVVSPHLNLPDLPFSSIISDAAKVDSRVGKEVVLLVAPSAAGGRLILSPTGELDSDVADVRLVGDAARKGVLRAKAAGSKKPLLLVTGLPDVAKYPEYEHSNAVALLGVLQGLYEPLQARETAKQELETVTDIGFVVSDAAAAQHTADFVLALEAGRRLARDVGGGDPERMRPANAAAFIQAAFAPFEKEVQVRVADDVEYLKKEYPLLTAVARASLAVPRHHPRVVVLEYTPEGPIEETLLFSGKGVTYDTGGADVKAGGIMAGMARDKCGAANIAGFVLTAAHLKVPKVKIVAELGFVRNSIGADSFVADEIITSHAGVRVQIGNTDAEGRLVLADCLSHLREVAIAKNFPNPKFMTVATLTGHAVRAVGPYTIALDNAPARSLGLAGALQTQGHVWGDPIEVSTLRREDFEIIKPKNTAFDVLQCNNLPSSGTSRGHQFPAAFIIQAAGLSSHGRASDKPFPFTHIDIAGSGCEAIDYQFGKPTATPLVALASRYLLPRLKR